MPFASILPNCQVCNLNPMDLGANATVCMGKALFYSAYVLRSDMITLAAISCAVGLLLGWSWNFAARVLRERVKEKMRK